MKPTRLEVQFLSFDGCPLADVTRQVLEQALSECGMDQSDYVDVDVMNIATPEDLRAWGSPSILINSKDFTGDPPGNAASCRLYDGPDGAPKLAHVIAAIGSEMKRQ
ncbi:MAG: hypothetical protein V3T39_08330 [Gammaproteobacteria bacterium]